MTYAEATKKLNAIAQLQEGWDSYGAKAPDAWCVARARVLLEQWRHIDVYEVSPLSSGGIQIGWFGCPSMEITIEPKEQP